MTINADQPDNLSPTRNGLDSITDKKWRLKRMLWWLVYIPAGVYLGCCVLMYFAQGRMVYFPSKEIQATPLAVGLEYEDVSFEAEDGVKISAWFLPAQDGADVAIFFHGNGGNISYNLDRIALIRGTGMGVLAIDYRGYGASGGSPTEAGTYLDAEAAWRYLTDQRSVDPAQIVIYGHSLGGSIAAHLAVQHSPRMLVVDSSFTSVADLGSDMYRIFPVRLLCRFGYDTQAAVSKVDCPVLIIHSKSDGLIPFAHGRRLFEAASEPKDFLELTSGHNDPADFSSIQLKDRMETLLDRVESPQP